MPGRGCNYWTRKATRNNAWLIKRHQRSYNKTKWCYKLPFALIYSIRFGINKYAMSVWSSRSIVVSMAAINCQTAFLANADMQISSDPCCSKSLPELASTGHSTSRLPQQQFGSHWPINLWYTASHVGQRTTVSGKSSARSRDPESVQNEAGMREGDSRRAL